MRDMLKLMQVWVAIHLKGRKMSAIVRKLLVPALTQALDPVHCVDTEQGSRLSQVPASVHGLGLLSRWTWVVHGAASGSLALVAVVQPWCLMFHEMRCSTCSSSRFRPVCCFPSGQRAVDASLEQSYRHEPA